jgi:hypothetical protein
MKELAPTVTAIASIISVVTALIAVVFAVWKFPQEGRRQRQVTAEGLYQAYLTLALEKPKLSWPAGKIPDDPVYPWFVGIMCNALGAQITAGPSDDMKTAMKFDLMIHEQYFESEGFKREGGWSLHPPLLKQLYDEARAEREKYSPEAWM